MLVGLTGLMFVVFKTRDVATGAVAWALHLAHDKHYRKEWRALVHMLVIEFHTAIFAWPCVLLDCPPTLWWIITWRGVGCHYIMRLG